MQRLHHCFATGVVLLIAGCWMRYRVGKRRFNRRTITGAERFRSYGDSLVTRMGEGIVRVVGALLGIHRSATGPG